MSYIKQYSDQSGLNGIQLWGYGFHFHNRDFRTLPIVSFVRDSGRTLVVQNTVIRSALQTPRVKKKSAATALNTAFASAHTRMTY
jgi:hypothetical protein